MKACIIGLGYIGLPTAITYALNGVDVLGVDVNPKVVEALNSGHVLIEEPEITQLLQKALETGRLKASESVEHCDAYFICVPTPLTDSKGAELKYVKSAVESLIPVLKKGDLVVLESTVPPGTTSRLVVPLIEKCGLSCEEDVMVAFCPERVMPGQIFFELVNNDRVIGGHTPQASALAQKYYSTFVKGNIYLTDATTAEFVKLAENTYRDVNIALANEFAQLCSESGIDVWEMVELASKHPRVNILRPGPGVGGHCIAVDPWYLVERFGKDARLIRTSREINDLTPIKVADMVESMAPQGGTIALLGLAYKGNIDDIRESPSLVVLKELKDRGFVVKTSDPHYKGEQVVDTYEAVKGADLILVLTDHDEYRKLDIARIKNLVCGNLIFDCRNVIDKKGFEEADFRVRLLGDGKFS
ncbi:MAG TPA: nucleotide sugar dehydrogenase [Euryarchaeota archaeon]|nr:nucleotide sugar dehydrogenase [Euryarchaeota archaeon]